MQQDPLADELPVSPGLSQCCVSGKGVQKRRRVKTRLFRPQDFEIAKSGNLFITHLSLALASSIWTPQVHCLEVGLYVVLFSTSTFQCRWFTSMPFSEQITRFTLRLLASNGLDTDRKERSIQKTVFGSTWQVTRRQALASVGGEIQTVIHTFGFLFLHAFS